MENVASSPYQNQEIDGSNFKNPGKEIFLELFLQEGLIILMYQE